MQRVGSIWGRKLPPSWQMGEDLSWPLTVALFIRDVLKLPATVPFFIPPLVPEVPEHIPVTGPELDTVLADEWAAWFSGLLADPLEIPRGAPIDYFSLAGRAPGFRDLAGRHFGEAVAAADKVHEAYFKHFYANMKVQGPILTKLVRTLEKELGHKAAPFKLGLRILPVEGFWLHRTAPDQVLISEAARGNPEQLRRLLGPVITELAR
jgi:hypothetical protein